MSDTQHMELLSFLSVFRCRVVLADCVLSLCSVQKFYNHDFNPVPMLQLQSENAEHCFLSTLGIALVTTPNL